MAGLSLLAGCALHCLRVLVVIGRPQVTSEGAQPAPAAAASGSARGQQAPYLAAAWFQLPPGPLAPSGCRLRPLLLAACLLAAAVCGEAALVLPISFTPVPVADSAVLFPLFANTSLDGQCVFQCVLVSRMRSSSCSQSSSVAWWCMIAPPHTQTGAQKTTHPHYTIPPCPLQACL